MTDLEQFLSSANNPENRTWQKPYEFVLENGRNEPLEALVDANQVREVIDPIDEIAEELSEYRFPHTKNDQHTRRALQKEIKEQGGDFGKWFYFPWSQSLVRYPEQQDHLALRTSRYRQLYTDDEINRMYHDRHVVALGMSVGSNIVDELVRSGKGDEFTLADFDTLSPSNLGRIRSHMGDVGLRKVDVMAKKISEIDPYIVQHHLHGGYDGGTDDFLRARHVDVLYEEIDDMERKAEVRRIARKIGLAVLMVTDNGERSILDVERYDEENNTEPFNGKISEEEFEDLLSKNLTEKQIRALLIKIAGGMKYISPRMVQSALDIDKTISGIPQLASTASAGAALASFATGELLLGRRLSSGTYAQTAPRTTLHAGRPTRYADDIVTYAKFAKTLLPDRSSKKR